MLSFRQKIFITYAIVFLLIIAAMYPFATSTVRQLVINSMVDRSNELIEKIQAAPNNDALIRRLKEQTPLIFFRVSVITDERKVLYDSHTKRLLGPRFSQEYLVDHPEVLQAFKTGMGYNEDYSDLLGQKFAYLAKAFDFHGKTYVMRTAFPYKYVVELTRDFEVGALTLATAVLLLYSLMTWFIINYMTKPIQQIINAVKPYQEGMQTIPEIKLKSKGSSDDFEKLASTLNSLSGKIQKHIDNLTHERNEKEAVLESLVEGVIAIDGNMIVTYANNMALKLLDFTPENLIGQNFSVSQQPKCYALLAACQQENRPLTDTMQIKREGKKLFLDIVAAPKKENTGAILVLQDKTSHYKLMEMRKDFVANASHELKTPITIIRGFAEALHDNPELSKETRLEATGKIVRNCQRMTSLIKDLLTLSDVENIPESRLIECDLYEVIQNCCQTVREVYSDAIITIHKPENVNIYLIADPNLMELAFINLIENAAKYSKAPAQIAIEMSRVDDKNKITIADKGIGIPKADLEHIFERFYTVDKAHSQKLGGSGLGLAIVETIIEKHFGTISLESELGVGTTFTIILPAIVSTDEHR
jgi:two-component system phosphate regulon sensor histidine kinase PhoR